MDNAAILLALDAPCPLCHASGTNSSGRQCWHCSGTGKLIPDALREAISEKLERLPAAEADSAIVNWLIRHFESITLNSGDREPGSSIETKNLRETVMAAIARSDPPDRAMQSAEVPK